MSEDVETVREALEEITKGMGAFSPDQLQHAENVIDRQKELARRGLELLEERKLEKG